jgi:hypothetical protein
MPTIQIKISGHLDERWQTLFEGFSFSHQTEEDQSPYTILVGPLPDQSAIYGCLARLRNLGVSLISLETITTQDQN